MNFHTFTYNEQIILFNAILWSVCVAVAFMFYSLFFSKKKNNTFPASSSVSWDDIFNYQSIALAINTLSSSGELTITWNNGIYVATLRSRLGFKTRAEGTNLATVLRSLDNETLSKVMELATKVGE